MGDNLCDPNEYFTSYENLEVHKLMLQDSNRVQAYKNAIFQNKNYIEGKTVMDVGCGTGILSVFCAQAGAKKVYAVEASNLAKAAVEIVKENKLDNIIQVLHSKIEDLVLSSDLKVDIIISEWMGFYLLHEGMLDTVLQARDKYLKEDGKMFPESATIYVAPCSVPSVYQAWENVHGVSMSAFGKLLRQSKSNKPEIVPVQPEDLLGLESAIAWINLKEDNAADLNHYSLKHVLGASKGGRYQGICVWFDCKFPNLGNTHEPPVTLGTGPFSMPTHWKQTVIILPEEHLVEQSDPIAFQMDIIRDQTNNRRYNLQVTMLDPETVEHPLPCSCHMTKCIIIKAFMTEHPENKNGIIVDEDINSTDEDENMD